MRQPQTCLKTEGWIFHFLKRPLIQRPFFLLWQEYNILFKIQNATQFHKPQRDFLDLKVPFGITDTMGVIAAACWTSIIYYGCRSIIVQVRNKKGELGEVSLYYNNTIHNVSHWTWTSASYGKVLHDHLTPRPLPRCQKSHLSYYYSWLTSFYMSSVDVILMTEMLGIITWCPGNENELCVLSSFSLKPTF